MPLEKTINYAHNVKYFIVMLIILNINYWYLHFSRVVQMTNKKGYRYSNYKNLSWQIGISFSSSWQSYELLLQKPIFFLSHLCQQLFFWHNLKNVGGVITGCILLASYPIALQNGMCAIMIILTFLEGILLSDHMGTMKRIQNSLITWWQSNCCHYAKKMFGLRSVSVQKYYQNCESLLCLNLPRGVNVVVTFWCKRHWSN